MTVFSSFIKRNTPVFVIGGITLAVFIGIIVLSQKNPPSQPNLVQIDENELVADHSYILGAENAPVTIVEFSDFQCPACRSAQLPIKEALNANEGLVRLVYRHLPLRNIHPFAQKAAEAAQAAGAQGKFWEYHDLLFLNQDKLDNESLIGYAEQLSLDVERFRKELENGTFAGEVDKDASDARAFGITGTPTFFLNGTKMNFTSYNDFIMMINQETQKYKDLSDEKFKNLDIEKIDDTYGRVSFAYTGGTFRPEKANARAGQVVEWENYTENPIVLMQEGNIFEEIGKGITIQPQESFELRVYGSTTLKFAEALNPEKKYQLEIQEYPEDISY